MVQGIMELLFDAAYLIFTFTVGVYLIVKGRSKFIKLFGVMAVVLSSGDAFHLIPRVYATVRKNTVLRRDIPLTNFLMRLDN